jgi:hypothetical protein
MIHSPLEKTPEVGKIKGIPPAAVVIPDAKKQVSIIPFIQGLAVTIEPPLVFKPLGFEQSRKGDNSTDWYLR